MPLGDAYALCAACGSAVYTGQYETHDYTDTGPSGFYGDRYWTEHVPNVLGLPGLEERARTDLAARAVCYLERVLTYVAPGSRVLEIGCAPGALAYLMTQAGLQVIGVELGATAVEFVSRTFGIAVRCGPLEQTPLEEPVDAIVAIDVLEHLPDPVKTLHACRERLADGGTLILQTPCYRDDGADWKMLVPDEHLFLFTEDSVRALLKQAGFGVVQIDGSLFPHDMWIVATRGPALAPRDDAMAGAGRLTAALVSLYHQREEAKAEVTAAARDRVTRESVLAALEDALEAARADQASKERLITRISGELETARADQAAKERLVSRVSEELAGISADRADKERLIVRLSAELETSAADRAAKEALIRRVSGELETARADQRAKEILITRVASELEAVHTDQAAKELLIARISQELKEVRADQQAKGELITRLTGGAATAGG